MKLLLPYLTAQGLALSGLLAQQNVVINFVPNATFNGSLNENADHPNDTIFTSAGGAETAIISTGITVDDTDSADFPNLMAGRGTFAPFTLTGIDADGATVTGTFTIEVTVTTNNTVAEFPIQRGGVGAPGVGNGTVDPGETITVSNPTRSRC